MYNLNKKLLKSNSTEEYFEYLNLINPNIVFAKSGIKIKKLNRGKFTKYCNGNVTQECINRGKHSSNSKIRKRAIFADNSRKWKH